jgi:hypothetical protein
VKLVLQNVVLVNKTLITVLVVLVLELMLQLVDVQFLTMKKLISLVIHVCKNVLLVPLVTLVILVTVNITE